MEARLLTLWNTPRSGGHANGLHMADRQSPRTWSCMPYAIHMACHCRSSAGHCLCIRSTLTEGVAFSHSGCQPLPLHKRAAADVLLCMRPQILTKLASQSSGGAPLLALLDQARRGASAQQPAPSTGALCRRCLASTRQPVLWGCVSLHGLQQLLVWPAPHPSRLLTPHCMDRCPRFGGLLALQGRLQARRRRCHAPAAARARRPASRRPRQTPTSPPACGNRCVLSQKRAVRTICQML
jgi:hypothetical protein